MSSSILAFLFLLFANSIFASEIESGSAETQLEEPVYEYDSDDGVFLVADFDENDNQLDELIFDDEDNWTVTDMLQDIRENVDFRFRKYIQAGLHLECPCFDLETGTVYDPLWFAVRQKSYTWIEKLLQTGHFDVNGLHQGTSMCLIDLAASMKDPKAIEILMKNGAEPNIVDSQCQTAIMKSLKTWDLSVFKRLLEYMDYVSVSVCFEALKLNNIRAFSLLLDSRKIKDINGTDVNGETILRRAILNDLSCRMLQKLISYPDLDINMASKVCGSTALHAAVEKGHATMIKILLQNRARVDIKNDLGLTALASGFEHAYSLGAPEIQFEKRNVIFGEWFERAATSHFIFDTYTNHQWIDPEVGKDIFFRTSYQHDLYEFDKLRCAREILKASTKQGLISTGNAEILKLALSELGPQFDVAPHSIGLYHCSTEVIMSRLDSCIARIDEKNEDTDEMLNVVEEIRLVLEN